MEFKAHERLVGTNLWTDREISPRVSLLVTDSGGPMPKVDHPTSTARTQTYRLRLRAAGDEEVLVKLPRQTIALLDEIKEYHGLRNRSQALLQLIERGREATQQVA